MNQSCRVCGEVAAGYHFGAFTCEGCKSFFGRTYNNRSSIGECKNNSNCIINKKNRTSCKSCRLKKCFAVGMSKSGSRYGRRSNWFKIHCLLQDQGNLQLPPNPPAHPDSTSPGAQLQARIHASPSSQANSHNLTINSNNNNSRTQANSNTPLGSNGQQMVGSHRGLQTPDSVDQNLPNSATNNAAVLAAAAAAAAAARQNPALMAAQQMGSILNANGQNQMLGAGAQANQLASQLDPTLDPSGQLSSQLYASAIAQFFAYCYLVSQRTQP